jgi:hypothetical protein
MILLKLILFNSPVQLLQIQEEAIATNRWKNSLQELVLLADIGTFAAIIFFKGGICGPEVS